MCGRKDFTLAAKKNYYMIIARKITKYGLFNYSRIDGKTTS
jgi:hypothetical protein